jgi:hypothetical protein
VTSLSHHQSHVWSGDSGDISSVPFSFLFNGIGVQQSLLTNVKTNYSVGTILLHSSPSINCGDNDKMCEKGLGILRKSHLVTPKKHNTAYSNNEWQNMPIFVKTKECNEMHLRDTALWHYLPFQCVRYDVTSFMPTSHVCKKFEIVNFSGL